MIEKIAGYLVSEVRSDSARIGFTTVTRQEVESLLDAIKSAPPTKLEIYDNHMHDGTIYEYPNSCIHFSVSRDSVGFLAASKYFDNKFPEEYMFKTASFCLRYADAARLADYIYARLRKAEK